MEEAIKLWVAKILGRTVRDLAIIRDPAVARELLLLFEPGHFRGELTTTDEILQAITQYYRAVHRINTTGKVKSLKQRMDVLGMWELLLGIAIKCPEKNTYIKMILNLDEQSQAALMSLINLISEDCPEMSMVGSQIDDGKDQKLEAALLATIDELTEENGQLRERLEALEEELEQERTASEEKLAEMKESLDGLRNQRLEVLGEYEAEYCSDSLLAIFKSMESERDQLRVILESKESAISIMERTAEDMTRHFDKMKEQNREIKRQFVRVKELEREAEESQQTIKELRSRQEKYVEEICSLQEMRANLRKTLNKTVQEATSDEPYSFGEASLNLNSQAITNDTANHRQSESSQQGIMEYERPSITTTTSAGVSNRSTTVKREMRPFVKQENNAIKVKKLQQEMRELTVKLEDKDNEIESLQGITTRKQQKIEDLELRCAHIERLNQAYSQNIKEKEVFVASKQAEYEDKFSGLLEEIESLKLGEAKLQEDVSGTKQEAENDIRLIRQQHNSRLARIVKMLEDQLLEFRDKQLGYLQSIRQLNVKLKKMAQQTAETQPEKVYEQVVDSGVLQQLQMAGRELDVLTKRNAELGSEIVRMKTLLQESLTRQTKLLEDSRSAQEYRQRQEQQIGMLRECCLKYMRSLLLERKDRQLTHKQQAVGDHEASENGQFTLLEQQQKELQGMIREIQQARASSLQQVKQLVETQRVQVHVVPKQPPRVPSLDETKKSKIMAYLSERLQKSKELITISQEQPARAEPDQIKEDVHPQALHSTNKEFEQMLSELQLGEKQSLRQKQQALLVVSNLTGKIQQKQQAIQRLEQQLAAATLEIQAAKQESSCHLFNLEQLKHKCYLLELYAANQTKPQEGELSSFVDKLNSMVNEISQSKTSEDSNLDKLHTLTNQVATLTSQNQLLKDRIHQLQSNTAPALQIRALRQANTKLIEQLSTQQKASELLRHQYRDMLDKCRSIEEQNHVLVGSLADLRISLHAATAIKSRQ